jgi:hypothetical protein
MGNRNNLGGDPSQWSNSRMTGVGPGVVFGQQRRAAIFVEALQDRRSRSLRSGHVQVRRHSAHAARTALTSRGRSERRTASDRE